jgi:hypothetical protein
MNAFTAAIDILFTDPNLGVDAIYRTGGRTGGAGEAITLRVIVRQPDRVGTFGEARITTETTLFHIRTSDIPAPAEGDTSEMNGTVYVIQGEPLRDAGRLIWTIEARPQ